MTQEVSVETQTDMAIKLHENVRDLIRSEVRAALEDHHFMGSLNSYPLSEAALRHVSYSNPFAQAVRHVVQQQMGKV